LRNYFEPLHRNDDFARGDPLSRSRTRGASDFEFVLDLILDGLERLRDAA
jgi:hypothetical protein